MDNLYYVAMRVDSSLTVANVHEAISYHKDDLFGPYRTYQQAADAAASAEFDLWMIMYPHIYM